MNSCFIFKKFDDVTADDLSVSSESHLVFGRFGERKFSTRQQRRDPRGVLPTVRHRPNWVASICKN
jgi:hypothetical protein